MSCGVRVLAATDDGSMAAGTFKISGDAVVDEVYPATGAVVTVAGALNNATPIQILPSAYTNGTQVVEFASDAGVTLAEACGYFTVKANGTETWSLYINGKIYEGYATSVSDLGTTISSLAKKYVTVSFPNATFTSMSGTLSDYITALTVPDSVTASGMGFLDLGENFSEFKVASSNSKFSVSDGKLYSADGTKLYRVPPAYTGTSLPILAAVTEIADGFIAGCKNIASFTVASGNTSFKAQAPLASDWSNLASSYAGLEAYQELMYFKADSTLGAEPSMTGSDGKLSSEWTEWNNQYQNQYGHYGYAPIPVLLSYDGKTIIACPPAVKLVTQAELMEKYSSTGAQLSGMTVSASDYEAGTPVFTCTTTRPYTFAGCETLTEVSVKITSTTATSAYLFYKCPELTYVGLNIPSSNIAAYSFTDCTKLTKVEFLNTNTTKVLKDSFSGCTSLNYLWFQAGENSGSAEDGAWPSGCTVTLSGQVN